MKNNKDAKITEKKDAIPEDAKKLVIARLNATSNDLRLVVGDMEYLRDMASGAIYQNG